MAKFIMVVLSHPPNAEIDRADYDRWYSERHIPEVLQLPEFISARRYELAEHVSGNDPFPYITHYEIEADSAEAAKKALIDAAMSGQFYMLEGLDTSSMITAIYAPMNQLANDHGGGE